MSSSKTNIPDVTWTDTGLLLPEESAIIEGMIQDFQNAFQNKLTFYNEQGEFLLSTPQGQLVTSLSALISDRNRLLAYYVNQVDPSYALGRMQDGIGRIYFIERRPATATEVVGVCTGGVGVVIPKGTLVQDQSSNHYQADQAYTIGDQGSISVTFVCTELGAIACPAHSLKMVQLIAGWDQVDNPNAGVMGRALESQQQFEQRRRASVAKNSVNSVDSIMSGLLTLLDSQSNPVCQDAYVVDNSGAATVSYGQVSLKPNSIYVCVSALDSEANQQAIAKVIWAKKPPGCDMNGEQTVRIVDDSGLYSTPPVYEITYTYAQSVNIKFNVVMSRPQFLPSDASSQIKNALYRAFLGEDGSVKPRIASQILASSFYAPIQALGKWANIISLQIGRTTGDSTSLTMGINEMPTLTQDDIQVIFQG
ncbi:hypothetical protein COMNV_00870 [Commensalibacter sp. Nvir]|uniref:baseplate J/gp47 family protein n=1 Tax=Commensalibacter sp. Nvir TaxID=3069817 RepID=UPI002D71932B|nr:hypothetical protein COMNV_00870 [Commensalibacter sp. Nvir]